MSNGSGALLCICLGCFFLVFSTFGLIVPYGIYAFNNPDLNRNDGVSCYVEPGAHLPVPIG